MSFAHYLIVLAIFMGLTLAVMVDRVQHGQVAEAIGAFVMFAVAVGLISECYYREDR